MNQDLIQMAFSNVDCNDIEDHYNDIIDKIINRLKEFNIEINKSQAYVFWHWFSQRNYANFLFYHDFNIAYFYLFITEKLLLEHGYLSIDISLR